eukprot:Sdes_comp19441_c0_seq3m10835
MAFAGLSLGFSPALRRIHQLASLDACIQNFSKAVSGSFPYSTSSVLKDKKKPTFRDLFVGKILGDSALQKQIELDLMGVPLQNQPSSSPPGLSSSPLADFMISTAPFNIPETLLPNDEEFRILQQLLPVVIERVNLSLKYRESANMCSSKVIAAQCIG